jgi:hypothetical protein
MSLLMAKSFHQVMLDNGLVQINFSIPDGHVLGINYNGIPDLLDDHNGREDRGYVRTYMDSLPF